MQEILGKGLKKVVRIFLGKMSKFLCGARTETICIGEMTKKDRQKFSPRMCENLSSGPLVGKG